MSKAEFSHIDHLEKTHEDIVTRETHSGIKDPVNEGGILEQRFEDIDESGLLSPSEKRKLTWKLDLRLMPILQILFFVNILDRVGVGAATAYGFIQDVNLTGNTYNIGVSVFFVFYCLCELPSNLILKRVGAKLWLPLTALGYGAISLATIWISSPGEFYAIRILLAATETCHMPAYYDRDQLALRVPMFLACSALGAGIGPILALGYVNVGQITPSIYGWRNIFFCNAMITFGLAIAAFFLIPKMPDKETMLTEKERTYIMARSKRMTAGHEKEEATKLNLILRGIWSPHVWFSVFPWVAGQMLGSALSLFLQIILKEQFGFTSDQANVRVAACFLFAFGVTIIIGFVANYYTKHWIYVNLVTCTSIMGSALFFYAKNPNARYAGAFFGALGVYGGNAIGTAWVASNSAPFTTRSSALAICLGFGSLGGIPGAWVFKASEKDQNYPTGQGIVFGFLGLALLAGISHALYCVWENKQRRLGKRDHRLDLPPAEVELLGNLHPHFKLAI